MTSLGCTARFRLGVAMLAVIAAAVILVPTPSSADPSLGSLNSQLSHEQSRQHALSSSIGGLSRTIASLDGQIALVRSREAEVRADLARDRAALARIRVLLVREQRLVALLRTKLVRAKMLLARQLVSAYEGDKPDLVGVVLEAQGFNDLLNKLAFLRRAEGQQQSLIKLTEVAKAAADNAERRLAKLEAIDLQQTTAAATRARALAGMNALLQSKQNALARAREAQRLALAASQARGSRLRGAIARLQAQQAAAQRAAAAAAAAAATATPTPSGPTYGPSGGWAIPYAIVLCESGGQNLSPNSAGASGYYQIMPATWKLFGGTGPAAYLASKSEQDAVARRIWNGGAGAHNWVCAGIVGIT
ncbi:MAG TPA: transglycosylase family protein [Solirubrobacteraceae bacterium]|nr:transglycosylase family protein [Solirubrobacteraceae bacterium]